MKKSIKLFNVISKYVDIEDFYSIEIKKDEVKLQGYRTPEMLKKYSTAGNVLVSEYCAEVTNITGIGYRIILVESK